MKVVPRLLILLLLGSTAVAEDAPAEEPFLEWLLEQGHVLLAPPKGPALADKARAEFLDAALPVLKRLTENDSPGLRGEALMTLAALNPDRSLVAILAGLESGEEELRRSAILAAGLSGHTGVLLPLERLVAEADEDPGTARLAAVAIGLLGPGLGSTTLQGQLRLALDLSQKTLAQELLAMLAGLNLCARRGDAAPLVFVLEQSKIQEPVVHQLALWVASRLDPAATQKLVEQTLRREREPQAATLACLAFPVESDKDAVPLLFKMASRPGLSPEIQIQALLSLGKRKQASSLQALQRLAPRIPAALAPFLTLARGLAGDKDKKFLQGCLEELRKAADPARRAAAALALGLAAPAGEGIKLRQAFEAEKDPRVQGALAQALALQGEVAVAGLLGQAFLETDSAFLCRSSALALALLAPGKPLPGEALQVARIQARPGPWSLRLRWLGLFGGEEAARLLLGLIADSETQRSLRIEALRALRILSDPRREPALATLLFHEPLPVPVAALTEVRNLIWGPPEGD